MSYRTYSLGEVAGALGCSRRWVMDQVRAGKFPARKIARHWRFTESDVQSILALCANNVGFAADAVIGSASNVTPMPVGLTPRSRKRLGCETRAP